MWSNRHTERCTTLSFHQESWALGIIPRHASTVYFATTGTGKHECNFSARWSTAIQVVRRPRLSGQNFEQVVVSYLTSKFTKHDVRISLCADYWRTQCTLNNPWTFDDLTAKTAIPFQEITTEMLDDTWENLTSRYELCRVLHEGERTHLINISHLGKVCQILGGIS